ncbi:PDC sensor domain-containing protein [Agromyces sp. SYSU T00194]|uniref:PDC sensor domain-containing protein n=1 Tax=Agromyces chitinivorans TaxID=3158560 RepID=UPI00339ADC8D
MSTGTALPTDAAAARIAATVDDLFALIGSWRDAVAAHVADRVTPLAGDVDAVVERFATAALSDPDSLVTGAGFVAAPGLLADAPWHLAWWLGDANTFGLDGGPAHLRRLEAVVDPEAESFRDYTTLEWWRVPRATGQRHLTGPYVDYLCTDAYTVTITEPVHVDGEMIGVVGADLYASELESTLLPVIEATGDACTVVNARGRVVASTDAQRAVGAVLRLDGLRAALDGLGRDAAVVLPGVGRVVACGDTTLALVVED